MISVEQLTSLIHLEIPDAEVNIHDKNGMGEHYLIYVRAQSLGPLNLMDRHRKVMTALNPAMQDGRLHAVEIKTDVPATF